MSRQIDKKTRKQIVIDIGWHKILKRESALQDRPIKDIVEEILGDYLGPAFDPPSMGRKKIKKLYN